MKMSELMKMNDNAATMTSKDIAELAGKRHDNAMTVCKDLVSKNVTPNIKESGTMSSLDLLKLVNECRVGAGESTIRNNDFLARIEDELDIDQNSNYENFVVRKTSKGHEQRVYTLTLDQCTLVGMRESKAVRRAVLSKLKELSVVTMPQTKLEWMKAAVEAEEALLLESKAHDDTKAELGVTKSVLDEKTIELDSNKEWSSIKQQERIHQRKFKWQKLTKWHRTHGIERKEVFDENYGTVKAYHADAWLDVYLIEI